MYNVVESPHLAPRKEWVQVRFPRSRKRRIRKKWAKDQRNYAWRTGEDVAYLLHDTLLVSPGVKAKMAEVIEQMDRAVVDDFARLVARAGPPRIDVPRSHFLPRFPLGMFYSNLPS